MRLLSYFLPGLPRIFVYMLQQVEYDTLKFLKWLGQLPNLGEVTKRQKLEVTSRAKITLAIAYVSWLISLLGGVLLVVYTEIFPAILLTLFAPMVCAVYMAVFNEFMNAAVVGPQQSREIRRAKALLSKHEGVKIAVLGSYGKTTMKELLVSVLGEGKKVSATPGNKNVSISHARWVNELSGDEEVLIFEFGEYSPGDIERMSHFVEPDWAIITGLSSAHLDNYGSLDVIAKDFKSIFQFCEAKKVYKNNDSPELKEHVHEGSAYTNEGCAEWEVHDVRPSVDGTKFTLKKENRILDLSTKLLGLHNLGPLTAVVDIAERLGLDDEAIKKGVGSTEPFEHRMKPYRLGSATVIDDTYNGNLEGMRAGLVLLKELEATQRIYVTPGLVEQGELTTEVHEELGKLIAEASPDKVVLMKNSVTPHIVTGLNSNGYQGAIEINDEPLKFYENLEYFVAAGDLVLMQNDWSDSYS